MTTRPATPLVSDGHTAPQFLSWAHVPYPPSGVNHGYHGVASGKLRKDAAVTAWQDEVVMVLRTAGLRRVPLGIAMRFSVAYVITTARSDVDSCAKLLFDAVAMALGCSVDSRGRTIVPDRWQGTGVLLKSWCEGRADGLEVAVAVRPMPGVTTKESKALFNRVTELHKDVALAMLRVEPHFETENPWEHQATEQRSARDLWPAAFGAAWDDE